MVINSFDQKMPPLYRTYHMRGRLAYFIDNFVIPAVNKKMQYRDIGIALIEKTKIVLRYKGDDFGIITIIGTDFMFVKK
jgi:hypothetical protein